MSRKNIIYIGMFIGGTLGSYIPALWGSGILSISSLLLSMIGGVAGIIIAFKITK